MAHFAQLDSTNTVLQVIVVNNETIDHLSFPESEPSGIDFCQSLFGLDTIWRQTSYNASFRKNYAGIGFIYNNEVDGFIPPTPYLSWVLNKETYQWESPVPYPNDGKKYCWDDNTQSWIEI